MSYSPFRHISSIFWKKNPLQLTFFLTSRCNARCPFCFYLSDEKISGDKRPELSLEEIRKISPSMGRLLWLAFSGGEIFLRDDIAEIAKVFYENNRPSIMLFPTNGLMTDVIKEKISTILNQCSRSTIAVKLSLEGTESVHDSIRGTGSFKRTINTYEAMGELLDEYPNFELGINTVFCSSNQDNMDDVIDFVKGMDRIRTHTVSLVRGAVADRSLKEIDIEKYRETIDKLALNLKNRESCIYSFRGAKLKAAQDILQRNLIYETSVRKKQVVPCYAGKLNLVLTESGDMYPCESFTMKLGNVRNSGYDVKGILKDGKSRSIIKSITDNSCFCTHECYLMTNILFNPRVYPKLLKEYLKL